MNSASSANHDKIQQESIPGGFALPAHHRTGEYSVHRGLPEETLLGTETAWTETLQDRDSLGSSPRRNTEPVSQTGSDIMQRPPFGQTDTLPQTLLMGVKRFGYQMYYVSDNK